MIDTDNDIILHFLILDLLQDGRARTAEEITDSLLAEYETLFDIQTVRRKCNTYEKEGLLQKTKSGKTVLFSLDNTLALWLRANGNVLDACSFFQMAGHFGIIGNELAEQFDHENQTFRVKHSFFVHTLEEEILLELLNAMDQQKSVRMDLRSSRRGTVSTAECVPLQIFISTRTGRRFLCLYLPRSRRFASARLDAIKEVKIKEPFPDYLHIKEKLEKKPLACIISKPT